MNGIFLHYYFNKLIFAEIYFIFRTDDPSNSLGVWAAVCSTVMTSSTVSINYFLKYSNTL